MRVFYISMFMVIGTLLTYTSLNAQYTYREYDRNDSTRYVLNADTSIIVSASRLYYHIDSEVQLIHDFTIDDSTRYIRDFDWIADQQWYVVIGRKNLGGPSILYKTEDKGLSWEQDTTFYASAKAAQATGQVAEYADVYQMQSISSDTLLLFIAYYQSGIFYSTDSGRSWDLWFANLPANYRGLLPCENAYYLWGLEGDGFRGSMFKFDRELLLSSNENGTWTHTSDGYHPACFNGSDDCVYAPNSLSGYDQFLHFKRHIEENCEDPITSSYSAFHADDIRVFPIPSTDGRFNVHWNLTTNGKIQMKIYSAEGKELITYESDTERPKYLDLSAYGRGIYYLVLRHADGRAIKKLVYH